MYLKIFSGVIIHPERENDPIIFSDIKNNRIQTYTDQDLTFVVPKGGVECFGIETEQLEDIDQGYKNHSS